MPPASNVNIWQAERGKEEEEEGGHVSNAHRWVVLGRSSGHSPVGASKCASTGCMVQLRLKFALYYGF